MIKSKKELVEKIKAKIISLIEDNYRIKKDKETNILTIDYIKIDDRFGHGLRSIKIRDIKLDLQSEDVKELYDFLNNYYSKQNDRIVINYLT